MSATKYQGSGWARRFVGTGVAAQSIDIIAPPVTPIVNLGSGSGTSGAVAEQGRRIVILSYEFQFVATVACKVALESVEDPNATAVVRTIRRWVCLANTPVTISWTGEDIGIPLPGRETVPAADSFAKLRMTCYTAGDVAQNFSAPFGAAASAIAEGVLTGYWAPFVSGYDNYLIN